jgi:hypothetical protein
LRAQTMQTSMRLDEPSQSNLQSFMVLMEAGQ